MYNIFRKMKSRAGGLVRLRGSVGCAAEYKERPGDFLRPGPQDYISLLADIMERLRPDISIGRIVSSVPPRFTDAPWGLLRQDALMRGLIDCLNGRNSFQGRLYSP